MYVFLLVAFALPEEDYSNRTTVDLSDQLPGDLIYVIESYSIVYQFSNSLYFSFS